MNYKGVKIELFGLSLFLHERSFADAIKLNEFWKDKEASKDAVYAAALTKIEVLKDALKFNFQTCYLWKIPIKPFRLKKLKRLITTNYLFDNIGIATLNKLTDKVIYELEGQEKAGDKEVMSTSRMISLVSQFTGISWKEAEQLPVSQFTARLNEAVNLAGLFGGGKFGLKSEKDIKDENLRHYEMVKEFWEEQGLVN